MTHRSIVACIIVLLLLSASPVLHALPADAGDETNTVEKNAPVPTPPTVAKVVTLPENDSTSSPVPVPPPSAEPQTALQIFGRQFFQLPAVTFEPSNDTPVPSDYVLGPGDKLSVVCWQGAEEYEHTQVMVSPAGEIYLKRIGTVAVGQKTLAGVTDELRQRYAKQFTRYNLDVQLVGKRTISIWVIGEVEKPGKYQLSSLGTVFTALYAAGGPTVHGSLRAIRVLRDGKLVGKEIDLYRYLIYGEEVAVPLKPGDTIFIPFAEILVTLSGEVRRPAIYELRKDDVTLGAALKLAGGVTANSLNQISVTHVVNTVRQAINLTLPNDNGFTLDNEAVVTVKRVPPLVRNAVAVEGAIYHPGFFSLERGKTVGTLLPLADEVMPESYLEQAILTRLYQDGTRAQIPVNLRRIIAGEKESDIPVQAGDVLRVFRRDELTEVQDVLSVQGAVVNPGTYTFHDGMRVADLVALAFGPTTDAYLVQALLFRYPPNAQPQVLTINIEQALAKDATANILLQRRDQLLLKSRRDMLNYSVTVDGEVNHPGVLPYYDNMRMSDAIFLAGGLKAEVLLEKALLIRKNTTTQKEELHDISLADIQAKRENADLRLQVGDRLVIYPPAQKGEALNVSVAGAVVAPGSYQYIDTMRVSHLLFLGKGVKEDAFLHRADLYRTRPDNTIETIPVNLDDIIAGVPTADIPLQPRDRLQVKLRGEAIDIPMVKIDGYIRKSGYYPFTGAMRLSDLVFAAGGLKEDAALTLELVRNEDGRLLSTSYTARRNGTVIAFDPDPLLKANDLVNVRHDKAYLHMGDVIFIDGQLNKPGSYSVYSKLTKKEKTLYEALSEVELTDDAYVPGIILYRSYLSMQHTTEQQTELNRILRNLDVRSGVAGRAPQDTDTAVKVAKEQSVTNLATSMAQVMMTEKADALMMVIPPRTMQSEQFSLSIPINVKKILESKGKNGNLSLKPGDRIFIPKRPENVTLVGGVMNNGSLLYREGYSLTQYIRDAGGISPDSDTKGIIVLHVNGQMELGRSVKAIQPGDIIIVPTKYVMHVLRTRGVVQQSLEMLSQLALTVLPFVK